MFIVIRVFINNLVLLKFKRNYILRKLQQYIFFIIIKKIKDYYTNILFLINLLIYSRKPLKLTKAICAALTALNFKNNLYYET